MYLSKRLLGLQKSSLAVAGVALLFYSAVIIVTVSFFGNRDLRDFALIGKPFINKSQASPVIKPDPNYSYYETGYDGQFVYYIALDPANARYYMDSPSYRYSRILYPAVAGLFSFGNPKLVPLTLVLVNLVAVVVGTWAIADWCRRRNLSPWFGLVYALYVGQVIGFTLDVTDLSAYALVALAIYLLERWPHRLGLVAVVFGLAGLARETTLVFPVLYAVSFFLNWGGNTKWTYSLPKKLLFLIVAVSPALLWQGFLLLWLGNWGANAGASLVWLPFLGMLSLRPFIPATLEVVQVILVPAMLCLVVVLWTMWRHPETRQRIEFWILLVNIVLFTMLLQPSSLEAIFSTGRISLGVVLGSIYILPYVKERGWFYICAGLWLSATIAFALNPTSRLFH